MIPINLATEDILSEAVLRKLLDLSDQEYAVGTTFTRGGYGYLKKTIRGFNNAARGTPFFVLTDLDKYPCVSVLISEWLPGHRNANLIFHVAKKEVETWLLADRAGLSKYLKIKEEQIPKSVEDILDPKFFLIELVKKSKNKEIRDDIIPPIGSSRSQGPNYNGRLIEFVNNEWNPNSAALLSKSLEKAIERLKRFSIES